MTFDSFPFISRRSTVYGTDGMVACQYVYKLLFDYIFQVSYNAIVEVWQDDARSLLFVPYYLTVI